MEVDFPLIPMHSKKSLWAINETFLMAAWQWEQAKKSYIGCTQAICIFSCPNAYTAHQKETSHLKPQDSFGEFDNFFVDLQKV